MIQELSEAYPGCVSENTQFLPDALVEIYKKTGNRFFFIIDEWDALFREAKEDTAIQKAYVQLLRGLFKGGPSSDKTIIGAYMTGILPIKKYGTESALTDFREYTMIRPAKFATYVGFTEEEVRKLCDCHRMDFEMMERWYDGYSFSKVKHIYSPNSVMSAIRSEEFGNYWTKTETYESLKGYISANLDGLKDAVVSMLGGQRVEIDTLGFQNDMISMNNRNDVLTLLIHLGYLAFDSEMDEVYIPNLEVADSFKIAVKESGWKEIGNALEKSKKLLRETIAYYTAQSDYTIVRELPAENRFADLAFIPRRHSEKPAMIVEMMLPQSH